MISQYKIDIEQVRKLASEGTPDREIGKLFGCSHQIIWKHRKAHGIPPGNPASKRKTISIERIRELASQGWSDHRIAADIGCSDKLVRVRRKEQGIEPGCPKYRNSVPAPIQDEGNYSVSSADAKFAKLLAGRLFGKPRKQITALLGNPLPLPDDISYTGSSARMCLK